MEDIITDLMTDTGSVLKDSEDDVAIYPNPFYGINKGIFPRADDDGLELVDGGEAGAKWVDALLVSPLLTADTVLHLQYTN